jgi:hypothetical protein
LVVDIEGGTLYEVICEYGVKGIFEPKRDEITDEWRKLHNEELNDLYPHPLLFG